MRRPDPRDLYELGRRPPRAGRPRAGPGPRRLHRRRLARPGWRATHLLAALGSTVVARFDVDQLHDYRARRPPMLFVEDHWESYEDPELAVHLLHDEAGTPFLLLAGPGAGRAVGAVRRRRAAWSSTRSACA